MHNKMESIGFSAYFNDVINHFYEDETLVAHFGRTLGFDIEKDVFLSIMFLYPSTEGATFEEKEALKEQLVAISSLPPINKGIAQNQFFYVGYGVATFLIGHDRNEVMEILPTYKKEALRIAELAGNGKKIRIGIGLPESGISGIKRTYSYAKEAIKAGEIFKRERSILEYMGMEIYSAINAMVTNYGKQITDIVFGQLPKEEINILAKYYKCKENIEMTAGVLNLCTEKVVEHLENVKKLTGLDVHDTEDSFKLHLLMIAKRVLDTNEKIKENPVANHYEYILLDIDDTLLDFQANEKEAFANVLADFGYNNPTEYLPVYKSINSSLWEKYEQGDIEKTEVLNTRFSLMMSDFRIEVNGAEWENKYRSYLNEGAQTIEGAESICQWLKSRYKLYAVSNGVTKTQKKRLKESRLDLYFEHLFISEEVGAQKPSKEFFEYVENGIPGFDKSKALIVGDSYTSDIQGGLNYGIDTCWLIRDAKGTEHQEKNSTYRISRLKQLKDILG